MSGRQHSASGFQQLARTRMLTFSYPKADRGMPFPSENPKPVLSEAEGCKGRAQREEEVREAITCAPARCLPGL